LKKKKSFSTRCYKVAKLSIYKYKSKSKGGKFSVSDLI